MITQLNSNSEYSWLYDPQYTMQTTINGQLLITMLAEEFLMELKDAQLLQTNTDGITIKIRKTDVGKYYEICKEWEKKTKLTLEYAKYSKMFIWDINNYISVYEDGKTKCKGRFEWEDLQNYKPTHLHKNKSHLIISKAIFNYFVNGILPETYLVENRNIYDYCGVSRIKKHEWKFEELKLVQKYPEVYNNFTQKQKIAYLKMNGWEESWSDDNWVRRDATNKEANNGVTTNAAFQSSIYKETVFERKELQDTIRYYISENGTKIIKKNKKDGREIQNQAGQWLQTVFNKYEDKPWEEYKVDDSYYLQGIYKEINNITLGPSGAQMSLNFD